MFWSLWLVGVDVVGANWFLHTKPAGHVHIRVVNASYKIEIGTVVAVNYGRH